MSFGGGGGAQKRIAEENQRMQMANVAKAQAEEDMAKAGARRLPRGGSRRLLTFIAPPGAGEALG